MFGFFQFRSLSTASECLFSLMNGDDIFTTFAAMVDVNPVMWWYSRAYLYIFVSLFIYVILSVFIAVIMDTYENLKACIYKWHITVSEMFIQDHPSYLVAIDTCA